jgi:hypothetical protein
MDEPPKRIRQTRAAARRVVEHAATVAAKAVAIASGDAPLADPEADTEAEGDALPSPPPMPGVSSEPPPPPSKAILAIAGDHIPEDPLEAMTVLYKLLVQSAREAVVDAQLTPATRRKELRTISVAAERLMPRARLYRAEQIVLSDRATIEKKQAAKAGAKLVARPGKKPERDFGDP